MQRFRTLQKQLKSNMSKLRLGNSLKIRAARGGLWLGIAGGGERGLRLVRNMILTRLLAPEVFGLMAIVLAINGAFETFTEIGIKQAIIQNPKGRESTYLNGAWWLSFGRALGLYTIAFFSAPWIADFYGNQELVLLIRVAFLSIIFKGAMSPKAYVAVKDMQFKHWTVINYGGGAIGIVTAVVLAFIIKSVWALAIGFTVESASRFLLSYIICHFCPGFTFEKHHLKALFKYVSGMFGLPILYFIFMRTDIFVIGKLCSKYDLGLYSLAVMLAWAPLQLIGAIFSEVAMPAFSEIQSDMNRMSNFIVKSVSIIAFGGVPVLFFVFLYGKDILSIIYGHEYAAVSLPFAIIFCSELLRTISIPFATLFLAVGQPKLHRFFTGVRAILIVILIYPAVKYYGLTGASMAVLVSMVVSFALQVNRVSLLIDFNIIKFLKIMSSAIVISFPVVLMWTVAHIFFKSSNMASMFAGILGCAVSYGFALRVFLNYRNNVPIHNN